MPQYYVGLDLGQRSDFTALAVIEEPLWLPSDDMEPTRPAGWVSPADLSYFDRQRARLAPTRPPLALRHLQRWPLGTSYPRIVADVGELLRTPPLATNAVLLVDATGVGRPTVDMLDQAGLDPQAITITGGSAVTQDGREYRVPKRDLAMAVQVLLQTNRLTFAAALPLLDVLKNELQHFEVRINKDTAHDSYLSWREGVHDDLVLAVSMACWYREWSNPDGVEGFSFAYDTRRQPARAPRRGW